MSVQHWRSASLPALAVTLVLHCTPAAATLLLDYEFVPATVTVVQGEDYTLTVRITNNSDAGETLGATGADYAISAFTIPGIVTGQTVTPLFTLGGAILSPGNSLVTDLAMYSTDLGALGLLAVGQYALSSSFGTFRCSGIVCVGSGIPGPTATGTLNVIAAVPVPATLGLLALGLCAVRRRRRRALRNRGQAAALAMRTLAA